MSETLNPDVQPSELNTANTPEQADNATMTELSYEQPVEETVEESSVTPEGECDNAGSRPSSRQEIIDRLKVIAESDDVLNCKAETEGLKVQFYRMRTAEIETAQQDFIAKGGDVSLFIPATDELEESFKEIMSLIKAKRNAWIAAQEQEMRANLEKKESLLAKLQSLVENASQGTPEVNEFKAIQSEWKEIKNVPQENVTSLWKQYQLLVEQFYDVLKINHEFREYDFKKNLEIKTRLCESAEALENEEDVINAFRQLQQLHNEFRETGPVSPELREEIWTRFKAASTNVNRRHQEHFEAKKEQEKENLEKKSAICEQIEAINNNQLTSYQAWNSATEKILELQAQWKEIGLHHRR